MFQNKQKTIDDLRNKLFVYEIGMRDLQSENDSLRYRLAFMRDHINRLRFKSDTREINITLTEKDLDNLKERGKLIVEQTEDETIVVNYIKELEDD